jgi:hypothetical protein
MSYCRWSCDNFNCDLYCYEDASGGWTTHVAGNRHIGECPGWSWEDTPEKMVADVQAQYEWLQSCAREKITLPHAGATFNDPTIEGFRARLLALREIGYRFPDYVLAAVEAEIAEGVAAGGVDA